MANEVLFVVIDIEFPDDMADSEEPYSGGNRLATSVGEILKIIRDGCTSQSFDYSKIISNSLFASNQVEMIYNLEEQ